MSPQKKNIIDISPVIHEKTPVWPGDQAFSRDLSMELAKGASIDLSSIHTTVHIGAHADAPNHFHPDGVGIDQLDLSPYLGACYVHTVTTKTQIEVTDCQTPVDSGAKRLIFRTLSASPNSFNEDFVSFSPEAMEFMGKNKVVLVGIDTPSVDPFESKELWAHHMLYKYQIRNLEGLVLKDVKDGHYELIALPLKLKGCDASPVRAVLRSM